MAIYKSMIVGVLAPHHLLAAISFVVQNVRNRLQNNFEFSVFRPIRIFIFGILNHENFDFLYFDTQEYLSFGFLTYPKIQRFSLF